MTKAYVKSVEIQTVIELNAESAEVLDEVLGYGIAGVVHTNLSRKYSVETLKRVFDDLRSKCTIIVRERNACIKAINEALHDSRT